MLRAAHDLFCDDGYAGTTMEMIAARAKVAVQTLYFTFHTKAALLEEVEGAAVAGFEIWVPPQGNMGEFSVDDPAVLRRFHAWFEPFEQAPTAQAALEIFLDGGIEIMERVAPMRSRLRASGDPDAEAVYDRGEVRRADAYRSVVRLMSKKPPGLRITAKKATDLLLVLFSAETYQMLRDRGWKPAEVRNLLLEMIGQQLLAD